MRLDQLLLGQIPEAIYFALFMILVRNIKEKRILFIVLMILEYIFLKYFLVYNIWFQVMYFILSFIIMKMLYRDKIQVTDIFTLGIASIGLVVASVPSVPNFADLTAVGVDTQTPIIANANLIIKKIA